MKNLPSVCARCPRSSGRKSGYDQRAIFGGLRPLRGPLATVAATEIIAKLPTPRQACHEIAARCLATPHARARLSWRGVALRGLLHDGERVAVGIGEERHPEIVVVHLRDPVRLVRERHAASRQLLDRERDVGAAKVDAALRPEILRRAGLFQQEADSRTVEEGEITEPEQLR